MTRFITEVVAKSLSVLPLRAMLRTTSRRVETSACADQKMFPSFASKRRSFPRASFEYERFVPVELKKSPDVPSEVFENVLPSELKRSVHPPPSVVMSQVVWNGAPVPDPSGSIQYPPSMAAGFDVLISAQFVGIWDEDESPSTRATEAPLDEASLMSPAAVPAE